MTTEICDDGQPAAEVVDGRLDAVAVEVLRHAFEAIADEMNATLMRAAFSTNITDRRDSSCAVLTPRAETVAQSESGTPLHLGTMPAVLRTLLARVPAGSMSPGDQYMCNTPYPEGPGHLNDVTVVQPVFWQSELVAFVANQAHHIDVGGMVPGSVPADSSEIFQEGVQIPPVRVIRAGEIVEDVLAVFLANIRTPTVSRGDLLAQAAANNVGAERMSAVVERWGTALAGDATARLIELTDRQLRSAIAEIPDGDYAAADVVAGGGGDVVIRVTVRVRGSELVADFSGTDPQVREPINCRPGTLLACLAYVVQATLRPGALTNAGTLRPLTVVAPEGSLVNARYPSSVVHSNMVTSMRVCDVLIRALQQVVPERTTAACSGTQSLVCIGGFREDEAFTYIETHAGASGGRPGRDGQSAVHTHMTNTLNSPVEVLEQDFPFRILEYALAPNSAGAGRWRGGFGLRKAFAFDVPVTFTSAFDRVTSRPWGVDGGGDGEPARIELLRDGITTWLPGRGTQRLEAGDVVTLVTPGAGGWGDPRRRSEPAARTDIDSGLVTDGHPPRTAAREAAAHA